MNRLALLAAAVATVISVSARAETKEMPPGLWEMKMKMEMPGMPPEAAAKMGDMTRTQCIKPGERKWTDQQKGLGGRDRQCEATDIKTDGNTTTWKMKCADGGSGEGKVVYNGKDGYTMENVFSSPKMPGAMKMSIVGKKIADTCEQK